VFSYCKCNDIQCMNRGKMLVEALSDKEYKVSGELSVGT